MSCVKLAALLESTLPPVQGYRTGSTGVPHCHGWVCLAPRPCAGYHPVRTTTNSRSIYLKDQRTLPRLIMGAALLIYCATLITLSCLKHATYHSALIDLGIFDQVIWNTAHGHFYWDTLDPFVQRNHVFLGQHFSPGIAILALPYLIAPSVYTLLVAQTLALASGAIPLYVLAARRTGDERIAALLGVAYLLYPSLAFANLFDFHEIVLAVPCLAWAIERLDAGRWRTAVVLLSIALLFKEEVGLIVAAFGAYAFLGRRQRILGIGLLALGLGWTAGVVFLAVPHIRGGPYLFEGRYQGGLLQNGSLHLAYLTHFLNSDKLGYVGLLLAPLLALPLLGGWSLLLPAPTVAYTLLSTYPLQYNIHYHYAAPLIPLLFAGTVFGLTRLAPRYRLRVAVLVLAAVAVTGVAIGPLPWQRDFAASAYTMGPRERAMEHLVSLVPPDAVLAVDNQMGAHLTERRWVTHFFTGYEHADVLLFDLQERSATEAKRLRAVAAIQHDPSWRLVARENDIVLYVRR
ncbi:MAG: hypothetical protein JWO42_1842 [Chloroflexi bacterium]|nr:hypothetical protein [Chloroflexota bacterium]